jgi:hypothetical protein
MRVGVEGARAVGVGNRANADRDEAGMGHGAARDTEQAQDMERHGTPREAIVQRGHPDASPRLDV